MAELGSPKIVFTWGHNSLGLVKQHLNHVYNVETMLKRCFKTLVFHVLWI